MESAVIARRSGWWEKQAHLYYVDYEAAKRREQHEPWYVRFAKWTFRDKDDR